LAQSATGYRIAGTVVNAVTGEPVRGATVAVFAVEDNHRIAAAQSANDGRFAIDGLAAAKYQLNASKRGYSTAAYDEHEEFSSAIVTGEDQDTSNLVFRLVPGAELRGVVTGDGGDSVEGAQVMLFLRPRGHEPGAKIVQMSSAITDDTGAYEFDNLRNGEYLLAVKAEPWFAMRPSFGSRQGGAGAANSPLDVAYPITYFDSTTDEAAASPIVLAGGNRFEANINLHAVPALHLQVDTPRKQDGSLAGPQLRQSVFGSQIPSSGTGGYRYGQMVQIEFSGIAPGHYELTQGDPPRMLELDANSSQQIEAGAGIPTAAVSGTLQTANGAPFDGQAVVTLEPADNALGLKPIESEFNQGAFSFAAVAAGRWKLRVEQNGVPVPVISTILGGHAHAGNLLTVQDRALTLVVRVSANGMRVEGFARKEGKGIAGTMVLLVPKAPAAFPDLVRRDQSDSDGSFALRDASPGEYTVVAIEDGWGLDWTRLEVIGRYLPGGIAVTLTDTREKVVRLAEPVPVQQR
jgi:5-hydroxyisourate hydrolase-like protein (transthyretin family)